MTALSLIRGGGPKRIPVATEAVACRDNGGRLFFLGKYSPASRAFFESVAHYPDHVIERAIRVMRLRGEIPTTAEMIGWMTHSERVVEAKRRGLRRIGGKG
jgi:hypothetical protein